MRKHVGRTQGTAPLVCRAEDQQAGPLGAPGCLGPAPSADPFSFGHRKSIWNLAKPDIGVFPDIGSPTDTISGHMSRYRGFLLTRYRDMSHVTRYRVPISGTYPISGHHVTDIVNHIPDIGINIGYNIRCPDIGDMISRYRCQYRVPISGVPISGYDSHRYRSQYRTRYRVLL